MKPDLTLIETHRPVIVPDEWCAEHLQVDRWPGGGPARHIVIGDAECAMPAARAADASHSSLLRVSTRGGIAIAAFALVYFGFQLVRGVL